MHFSYMAHKNENSTKVPYAPPTRLCRKYAGEFPPISPTLAQENRGSRNQWATLPRTTLTRLSIHREGHRNEEAKRHGGRTARQSKLCAARQGPTLYLEAWKKQGLRAAPFCNAHIQTSRLPAAYLSKCHLPFRSHFPLSSPNSCVLSYNK